MYVGINHTWWIRVCNPFRRAATARFTFVFIRDFVEFVSSRGERGVCCLFVLWALILCEHCTRFSQNYIFSNLGRVTASDLKNGEKRSKERRALSIHTTSTAILKTNFDPFVKICMSDQSTISEKFLPKPLSSIWVFSPKLPVDFFGWMPSAPLFNKFLTDYLDDTKTIFPLVLMAHESDSPRGRKHYWHSAHSGGLEE